MKSFFSALLFLVGLSACAARAQEPGLVSQPKLQLVMQTGHTGSVVAVALSAEGKLALTGSSDATAILWDTTTGKQIHTFTGHTQWVRSVALSADGKQALTGSEDGKASLWDTVSGKKIYTVAHPYPDSIISVALSPDGKQSFTGGSGGQKVFLWEASGKKIRTFVGHKGTVTSISLSADGKQILTGSSDKTAILWDVNSGEKIRTFTGHDRDVYSVVLSADGKQALTGSERTAILWDTTNGERIHTLVGHVESILSVSLSADGKQALTGSSDKTAILWDTASGMKVRTLDAHAGPVWSATLSPDGKQTLTGHNSTAILWDTSGHKIHTFAGQNSVVTSMALSGDGKHALTGYSNKTVILWDPTSGKKIRTFSFTDFISSVALSADGKQALAGFSWDGGASFWDTASGKEIQRLAAGRGPFVALSADGKKALTGDGNGTPILWDTTNGNRIHTLGFHVDGVRSVALSPDGRYAMAGPDQKTATLWDTMSGKKIHTFAGHQYSAISVALSANGRQALTGSHDTTAMLWDTLTGKKLQAFAGHSDHVTTVALSVDGNHALTGSLDKSAILWDTSSGKKIHTFAHSRPITATTFSVDGRHALTGSMDGIRLWDTATGKELCSLISIDAGKDWLVTTPDGYFDGSENAAKLISYRITGTFEFVPFERYRKQFERLGLFAMIYKGEDYRNKDIKQDLPPIVRVTAPGKSGYESKDGKLTVEAEAQSRGEYPVTSLRLLVNGRPYPRKFGVFEITDPKPGKAVARWDIELEPGRHTIEVHAHTKVVFGVSKAVEVRYVGGNPNLNVELPILYVFAVGISKYPTKGDRLEFAHKDAEAIAKALQTHGKPLFKRIEVKVLIDEKATREEIMDGLDWLRRNMTQRDFGVFFFAGHGLKDETDTLYFLPADVNKDKLARSAIDGDVLAKELMKTVGQLSAMVRQALVDQKVMLEAKLVALRRWSASDRQVFAKWFGTSNENSRQMIHQRVQRVLELNQNYSVSNFCRAKHRPNVFAYVYADQPDKVYVDDLFLTQKPRGENSRAGTITHEMSHFKIMGGTRDHVYGQVKCKALARTSPNLALTNADNFEFWAEGAH
jgi:WD40 repeat protein